MKKNRIKTTSVREIKSSFKRFLSLLVMSLLGVGVFVGISMAAPDMMKSLDTYYDEANYYDIKLISTLGLTEEDVLAVGKLEGVDKVVGTFSKDVLVKEKDNESVVKVLAINDKLNKVSIEKGKAPTKANELVVEEAMLKRNNLKIGDEITFSNDDTFKNDKFKIVGTVKSPLYISSTTTYNNRGNTNLGTGKIDYYAYVSESSFNIDYYTELYVTVKRAKEKETNSEDYNDLIDNTLDEIKEIQKNREDVRYEEIYNEINDEINKEEEEGLNKFLLYKNELDSAKSKLQNGKYTLDQTKKLLDNSLVLLENNKIKLDKGKNELDLAKEKLDKAKTEIDQNINLFNEKLENYNITFDELVIILEKLENNEVAKEDIIKLIPTDAENYDQIIIIIDKIYELGIDQKLIEIINNPEKIDEIIASIPEDSPYYEDIVEGLNYVKENILKLDELKEKVNLLVKAKEDYEERLNKYNDSLNQYKENYKLYETAYNEYDSGKQEYSKALVTYNNNLNLYNNNLKEYYESRSFFETEITNAKKKLEEIPESKWYIYDRLDNSEYSNYINDSNSIANLSKVFPSIFFIVAVLISLISMSRMVEDDRMQIGTLKSLGFSNKHIRLKYLLYSGIATLLGGILGSLLGFYLLPMYIWNIYKMLFDVPIFVIDYDITYIIIGLLLAVICICGTTLLTVKKVLKEKPSDLMRPKAPAKGKRVILEKMPFIWNNISFSNKVTIRNLFRYKKRVLMTVVGILGCTSLMLAGFGIRDAIVDIPKTQYGSIFKFDDMAYMKENKDIHSIFNDESISLYLGTKMDTGLAGKYSINIFVPESTDNLSDIVELKSIENGKKLELEDNKIIISDKLSQLTKTKVGDKLLLTDSNNVRHELVISGICENYVGHYIFMNKETYEKNIGKYDNNVVYYKMKDLDKEEEFSSKIIEDKNAMSVISVSSTMKTVDDMLKSLDSVVVILIFLSAALSFVVLYNLSYININERKREIATLKVLGFTHKEVDNYITKETIILTIIGIVLGLMFGTYLTGVIVDTVEIESVRFIRNINLISFIISSVMTIFFTIVVNVITHFTLKKIDMIESLKSVE